MSTPALVGKENANGTVTAIYVHFDGYLSGVGESLQRDYRSDAAVDRLLALGNLSTLVDEVKPYGGDDEAAASYEDGADYTSQPVAWGAEYLYLWQGGAWHY